MTRVLWIVQDGVLVGPGASQVLPYLRGLPARGVRPRLLSFEKPGPIGEIARVRKVARRLAAHGVSWTRLPYGSGSARSRTLRQIVRGVAAARAILRREAIDLVHARSYVPALIATALPRPFVFDMRGLWPRERVDGGLWREGSANHVIWTRLERLLLRRADGVVLLARKARDRLPPIESPCRVIPSAVDLERFRPDLPPPPGAEGLGGRVVWTIAGALGTWYRLDAMLDLLAAAIRTDPIAHALILSEEDRGPAVRGLRRRGVPATRITALGVPFHEVPRWFSLPGVGILLIRSAPSKEASSPTKLGEFLASGRPVVLTPRIGDSEDLVTKTRTGVVLRDPTPEGLRAAVHGISLLLGEGAELRRRCRTAAALHLGLPRALDALAELHGELA